MGSKIINVIGILTLFVVCCLSSSKQTGAAEITEAYPNNVDSSLQEMFDRLCDSANANDTINMLIAAGEYHEQIFTICNKLVNVRIKGAGIDATTFVSDNFKTVYGGLEADRQIGGMISCIRATTQDCPGLCADHDGNLVPCLCPNSSEGDRCSIFGNPNPAGPNYSIVAHLCKLQVAAGDQDFALGDSFCEVSDLSVEGRNFVAVPPPPTLNIFNFGIQGNWNRLEVSEVRVGGFPNIGILCPNCAEPKIHHAEVRCSSKTPIAIDNPNSVNGARPLGLTVISNSVTNQTPARSVGTNVHQVDVSNCATGVTFLGLPDGSFTHNRIHDNLRGGSGILLDNFLFSHNRIVRSDTWGMRLTSVINSFFLQNQFFNNFIAMEFVSSSNNMIKHNLNLGNDTFVIPEGPLDEFTIGPPAEPQGW